jgi:hypothetical protein
MKNDLNPGTGAGFLSLFLPYRILQPFPGFKHRNFPGGDIDFLAGLGIASFSGGAFADIEAAETNQTNFVAFGECAADGLDNGIKGFVGIFLGQFGVFGNLFDKICFGQLKGLLNN